MLVSFTDWQRLANVPSFGRLLALAPLNADGPRSPEEQKRKLLLEGCITEKSKALYDRVALIELPPGTRCFFDFNQKKEPSIFSLCDDEKVMRRLQKPGARSSLVT